MNHRLANLDLLRGLAALAVCAEHQLYEMLRQAGGDAYSRYNALLRELISFEQALDFRRRNLTTG